MGHWHRNPKAMIGGISEFSPSFWWKGGSEMFATLGRIGVDNLGSSSGTLAISWLRQWFQLGDGKMGK